MRLVMLCDTPSDVPGKTWREKNLELKHNIPIGTLVELDSEDCPNKGIRLLVCTHSRDCDGEPLYNLTWDMEMYERYQNYPPAIITCIGGFSEESLTVIHKPMSTAEEIAAQYGNDGHNFHNEAGVSIGCYCQNKGAQWHINPFATDTTRFVFPDGSAIVIAGDAWDIEGKEMFSFAGCE